MSKMQKDVDDLNRSLTKTIDRLEIVADMRNSKVALDKLSKKIVSAWKGGGGA